MIPAAALLSSDILLAFETSYGAAPRGAKRLTGGHQSATVLLDCEGGPKVLKIGPSWRSSGELDWSYRAAGHVAQMIPEAALPCRTRTGQLIVRVGGRPMTVWHYIEGRCVNVASDSECDQSAAMLGRMHARLGTWRSASTRPPTSPRAPARLRPSRTPDALQDAGLDRWLAARRASRRLQGPIHGDFWGNNVLHDGNRITAIIDWDDTRIGSLDRELAWAVWEFCADPGAHGLDDVKAARFLDIYASNGGPVEVDDRSFIIPLIREHLRYEALRALGAAERGQPADLDYVAGAIRNFAELRGHACAVPPRAARPALPEDRRSA